jgi:hypothetical protein
MLSPDSSLRSTRWQQRPLLTLSMHWRRNNDQVCISLITYQREANHNVVWRHIETDHQQAVRPPHPYRCPARGVFFTSHDSVGA